MPYHSISSRDRSRCDIAERRSDRTDSFSCRKWKESQPRDLLASQQDTQTNNTMQAYRAEKKTLLPLFCGHVCKIGLTGKCMFWLAKLFKHQYASRKEEYMIEVDVTAATATKPPSWLLSIESASLGKQLHHALAWRRNHSHMIS